MPLLSPNTLQLLDDVVNELTKNSPPTDYTNIVAVQTNEMASHIPIVEQSGGGGDNIQEGNNTQFTTLPDFQRSNLILNTIVVYTATFGDPFNSLMGGILYLTL